MPETCLEPRSSLTARSACAWQLRDRVLPLGPRTLVMGILNVTPDSFSDGGLYVAVENAVAHGLLLLQQGADILDIGGESTRPDATPVSAQEELERVLPVVRAIRAQRREAILSVDTSKAEVAHACVLAGADIVNDVSGLHWDSAMAATCAELGCGVVAMHSRGRPSEWRGQARLRPEEVLPLVRDGLAASLELARRAGVAEEAIVLDPGFGFASAATKIMCCSRACPRWRSWGGRFWRGFRGRAFCLRVIGRLRVWRQLRRRFLPARMWCGRMWCLRRALRRMWRTLFWPGRELRSEGHCLQERLPRGEMVPSGAQARAHLWQKCGG